MIPTRTALFLGRIYPIKGLPMLIEAWARVRPRVGSCRLQDRTKRDIEPYWSEWLRISS